MAPPSAAPGESPRKQTGFLRSKVQTEVQQVSGVPVGRAGTNAKYGRPLEMGAEETRDKAFGKTTRPYHWRLEARPWLRRALKEMTPFIKAVMGRPWRI